MLSPSTRQLGPPPRNSRAITRACGRPSGARLYRVLDVHAPLAAVAEQPLEEELLLRRVDDQHVADAGEHQHTERVIDHGLVVDWQQLLADAQGDRMQSRARTTRKNYPLAS